MNKTNFGIIIILIIIVLFSISKNNKKVIIENLPDGFKKSEILYKTKAVDKIGKKMNKRRLQQQEATFKQKNLSKFPDIEGFTTLNCGNDNFVSYGKTNPNKLNARICNLQNNLTHQNKSML